MEDVFLNATNFGQHTFFTLVPPSGYTLNLKHWSKCQKLSEHISFCIKYCDLHWKENSEKTIFISPKKHLPVKVNSFKDRVSVQGVKSLGGNFACLYQEFDFYGVKKKKKNQKERGNTFTLLSIFIVKSLQKEQNSTYLLLWPPICRNKRAITPKVNQLLGD